VTQPLGADAWWDYSWNPVGGCTPVSPGCAICYSPRALQVYTQGWKPGTVHHEHAVDLTRDPPVFTGRMAAAPEGHKEWTRPLKWSGVKHPKLGPGRPSLIFCVDMGDLFHADRPTAHITRVFATIALSGHIGLIMTKRVERLRSYCATLDPRTVKRWQQNVWLGFSAERQREFDLRWPHMRALAAAGWFTFANLAPMLGPERLPDDFLALGCRTWCIASGEQCLSPELCHDMNPSWARAVRDQCRAAGIPFFFKQMAKKAPIPPDLLIREFPAVPPRGSK
jgi:protein gp37